MGIEIVGGAELIDYPGQFAADLAGQLGHRPAQRPLWVLKLLRDNFNPGDKLVETHLESPDVFAQAFRHPRRVNGKPFWLTSATDRLRSPCLGQPGHRRRRGPRPTGSSPPAATNLTTDEISLNGLAVAVVTLEKKCGPGWWEGKRQILLVVFNGNTTDQTASLKLAGAVSEGNRSFAVRLLILRRRSLARSRQTVDVVSTFVCRFLLDDVLGNYDGVGTSTDMPFHAGIPPAATCSETSEYNLL